MPNSVAFVCEKCGHELNHHAVRDLKGRCNKCKGESWSIHLIYKHVDRERDSLGTAVGIAGLALGSVGWASSTNIKHSTDSNSVRNIPGQTVIGLLENRATYRTRLLEFVRLKQKQDMRDKGGGACKSCDTMFAPGEGKPWTKAGYCSKACGAKGGWRMSTEEKVDEQKEVSPTISVSCPNGHKFEVLASFSGCRRPCLECGEKTEIPHS